MRLHRVPSGIVLSALAGSLLACGAPPEPRQAEASGPVGEQPTVTLKEGPGEAHALALQAIGCWFGGLWTDAEGAAPEDRRRVSEKRCSSVVNKLYGVVDDKARYDQLRLVDAGVVDRLAAEVEALAKKDSAVDGPHKDALVRLVRAVAAAQRENNDAHTASDAVKLDLKNRPPDPDSLSKDESTAVAPLRAHAGLAALLKLDAGDLTAEAHTIAILTALDRLELARSLPKHLKVYAVGDALELVFGVAAPSVPNDATTKLTPGVWLGYLIDVAKAAGHAVPEAAKTPREREPWAWGGVVEGLADKLRGDLPRLSGNVATIASAVVKKLDAEWAGIPELAARQSAMGQREAADKPRK